MTGLSHKAITDTGEEKFSLTLWAILAGSENQSDKDRLTRENHTNLFMLYMTQELSE